MLRAIRSLRVVFASMSVGVEKRVFVAQLLSLVPRVELVS